MGLLSRVHGGLHSLVWNLGERDEIPDTDVRNTFFPTEPTPWGAGLGVAWNRDSSLGSLAGKG